MQHRVPEADLEEEALQLAEYLGQEDEHEDDYFEYARYLYVHPVLHKLRQDVQHQHIHAYYRVVVLAYPDAAYQDEYDDGAQDHVRPKRARFLLGLARPRGARLGLALLAP